MIYEFSEETIAKKKRLIYMISILMPPFLAVLIFCTPVFPSLFIAKIVSFLFTCMMLILIAFIVSFAVLRQLKQMCIKTEHDSIVRIRANSEDTILLEDIVRVVSIEDKDGIPVILRIYSKDRTDHLFGFKSMDDIRNHISSNTAIEIENKVRKVDWESPKIFVPYFVIINLIMIVAFNFSQDSYMRYAYIIGIFAGFFFIVYKPLSKSQGSSKEVIEIIIGMFLIIFYLLNFILSFT